LPSSIAAITLAVPDFGTAIAFYVGRLGFRLLTDTDIGGGKRWVTTRLAPSPSGAIRSATAGT
jgi:catechol 2,3-dioxygenase-like lactoylglutathione lyase family enzyme